MNLAKTVFKKAEIIFSFGGTEAKITEEKFGFRYGIGVVETGKSLRDNALKILKVIMISPVLLIAREETEELALFGQLLRGALDAELFQLVKFNADPKDKDDLIRNLPAMEAPTISNLSDGAVAIETIVPKNIMSDTIIAIRKGGGKNIIIQDITVTI